MANLDRAAWFIPPDGSFTGIFGSGTYADSPGGGVLASQIGLANSICSVNATYGPQSYAGGHGQNGPATLPVKIGTIFWNTMQMLYGTVEVSGKLAGTGCHTAFWLYDARARQELYQCAGNGLPGDFGNEIDIVEAIPFVSGNLTTIRQNAFSATGQNILTASTTDVSLNSHVYRMVWTPSSITFLIDGVQTNQITTNIPNGPMIYVGDFELADAESGDVVAGNFPASMQIDYVKAWDANNNLIFSDDFDGSPAFQNNTMSNIVYNQSNGNFQSAANTSIATAFSSGTISGSLLLAFGNGITSIVDTLGNAWIPIGTPFDGGVRLFYVPTNKTGGGANTVTATGSSIANRFLYVAEYTGQAGNPIDAFIQTVGTGQNASSGPVACNTTNETLVTFGINEDFGLATTGSGTIRLTSISNGGFLMDQGFSTPGSVTATWKMATSGNPYGVVSLSLISTSSQPLGGGNNGSGLLRLLGVG